MLEEIIPVSHGSADPPNPATESTHRECLTGARAKNREISSGNTGASAAPNNSIATGAASTKPTSAPAANSAATTTTLSTRIAFMRVSSSADSPRETRNPHQYNEEDAAAFAAPVLAARIA